MDELEKAEKAYADLIEERRVKRDSMSKPAFRKYNESSAPKQVRLQAAVASAQNAAHLSGQSETVIGVSSLDEKGRLV